MATENKKKYSFKINVWLITMIFVILKLFDFINWSWIWIFSPIWITYGIVLITILIGFFIILISTLLKK